MLVLTRKLGENIRIGDAVKITVLEIRSGQVKLGIEAPPEVKVHREEIYQRIQEEQRKAPAAEPHDAAPPGSVQDKPPPVNRQPNVNRRPPWPLSLIKGGKKSA